MPREDSFEAPAATEAVVQADIGGMTIAFTAVVGAAEINERLDAWRKAINRQRAQNELVEALVDIQARRDALAAAPDREREVIRSRLAERAVMVASWQAAHETSGKRAAFSQSPQQRQALLDYDAETERKKAEFAGDRAKIEAELPLWEARADRARRIIDGAERAEVIGDMKLAAE